MKEECKGTGGRGSSKVNGFTALDVRIKGYHTSWNSGKNKPNITIETRRHIYGADSFADYF